MGLMLGDISPLLVLTQKIFKGLSFLIVFLHCQLNAKLQKSTHYYRLSEPVFIITCGNISHSSIARAILEVY